jgi:hypothetical protein
VKQEQIIERWMPNIVEDGGIERFDYLHIDKIDNNWKPRQMWIEAGVQSYRIALGLRDEHQLPFVVSLGFSLEACEQSPGLDFRTREELQQRLNHTPPSLYLFERGKEPWAEMDRAIKHGAVSPDTVVQKIDWDLLDCSEPFGNYFYLEFRPSDAGGYHRSVFVGG